MSHLPVNFQAAKLFSSIDLTVSETTICFDPAYDADGNPEEARLLTSVVSFVSFTLVFLWLIGLISNNFKPGFLPKAIALENSPFAMNVFNVSNFAVCLLSMALWRTFDQQSFYLAYQMSITVSQCSLIFNHALVTSKHVHTAGRSFGGKPLWITLEVVFVFYYHFASSTYAIWDGPFAWLKWIVYDGLWLVVIGLVMAIVFIHQPYRSDKSFLVRLSLVVVSCVTSYLGWLAGVWFLGVASGLCYSIWILFLALLFASYSVFVDYLWIEAGKRQGQRHQIEAGKRQGQRHQTSHRWRKPRLLSEA